MTLRLAAARAIDKISILLVDDHAVVRQGLRSLLELHEGLEVVGEAADGREAVEQARKMQPDLVLMDLVMPNMDGIEATRRICSLLPATQVIVLTSYVDEASVRAAKEAGAMICLQKGLAPSDLVKAIFAVRPGPVA